MSHLVLTEIERHVATLTLDQQETRNAISDREMVDALRQLDADLSVRAIFLTGSGSVFSAAAI